jgi:hypothetical protein
MLQPPGSIIELCHVVADLEASIAHWVEIFGAGPFYAGEMRFPNAHFYRGRETELAIKVGFGFSGGLLIELVEPLEGDVSVFGEVLTKRGPGYHHVMLRGDYDEGFAKLTAQGFEVALQNITPLGERCALFDTQTVNGGFVELMDMHIGFGHLTEIMATAHEGWDGNDPIRPMAQLFEGLKHD